jgi:branched-chain amino acid transport system permease protein
VDIVNIFTGALNTAIGPTAAMYAIAAIGLNVHYGYAGLLNFGQVGFMLMGAWGLAASVSILGLPLWAGILCGLGASTMLALLLGAPTLRLRADYLAISTIAAAEILRFVFRSNTMAAYSGGPFGIPSQIGGPGFTQTWNRLNPFPPGTTYQFGPFGFTNTRLWTTLVGWTLVGLAVLLVWALMRSPWGRVVKSIREDEDAARALGKNVFAYKMQSLILGGCLGGVAGMLFVLGNAAFTADAFLPQMTFYAYAVLILGGAATVFGPVIGSIMFWFLLSAAERTLQATGMMPSGTIGPTRLALVGLLLILLMAFRPQGVFGNKREMMLDA